MRFSSSTVKSCWHEAFPCPVCGRRGWCRISPDGSAVACRRQEYGALRTITYRDGSQSWLHRIGDGSQSWLHRIGDGSSSAFVAPVPPRPGIPRAADADLDRVYRALLSRLRLVTLHRQQLQARGLTSADIDRAGYRSLPAACRAGIVRPLRDLFADEVLLSIPGLVCRQGPHGAYLTVAGLPGLLVPVRSAAGHIVGLVVRPDDPGEGKGKYRWLSSRWAGGPSPGSRVHVPVGVKPGGCVALTEGMLKADVACALAARIRAAGDDLPFDGVLGLPGPHVNAEAIAALRALEATAVLLTLDADTTTNRHVAQAQCAGLERLKEAGFAKERLRWTLEEGKGLDDVLLGWTREEATA